MVRASLWAISFSSKSCRTIGREYICRTLVLQEFIQSQRTVTGISNHLGVSVAIRAAIILLFPFATQFVLQKTDVD